MKYSQHHFTRQKTKQGSVKVTVIVILAFILAVLLVILGLRDIGNRTIEEEVITTQESAQEIKEDVQMKALETVSYPVEEILLHGSGEFSASGIARRGIESNIFTHVIVTDLPPINQDFFFYEGWLVIPGVTEFFSTGVMFLREDGKWGLVLEEDITAGYEDVLDYSRVIITREPFDNDPAPDIHVAEGDF